jgi:hypothetical protein
LLQPEAPVVVGPAVSNPPLITCAEAGLAATTTATAHTNPSTNIFVTFIWLLAFRLFWFSLIRTVTPSQSLKPLSSVDCGFRTASGTATTQRAEELKESAENYVLLQFNF